MTELPKCEEGYRWLMEGELVDRASGDQFLLCGSWELTGAFGDFKTHKPCVYRRPVKQEQEKPMRTAEEAYDEAEKSGVVISYLMGRPVECRLLGHPNAVWNTAYTNFTNPNLEWRIKPAEITPTIAKWYKIERDPVKARQMEQPTTRVALYGQRDKDNPVWNGTIARWPEATHWAPLPAGPKDGE